MEIKEIKNIVDSKNNVYIYDNNKLLKLSISIDEDILRTFINLMDIHAVSNYRYIDLRYNH